MVPVLPVNGRSLVTTARPLVRRVLAGLGVVALTLPVIAGTAAAKEEDSGDGGSDWNPPSVLPEGTKEPPEGGGTLTVKKTGASADGTWGPKPLDGVVFTVTELCTLEDEAEDYSPEDFTSHFFPDDPDSWEFIWDMSPDHLFDSDHWPWGPCSDAQAVKVTTGADGSASLDLEPGLYLVAETDTGTWQVEEKKKSLVTMPKPPSEESGDWEQDFDLEVSNVVTAPPDPEPEPTPDPTASSTQDPTAPPTSDPTPPAQPTDPPHLRLPMTGASGLLWSVLGGLTLIVAGAIAAVMTRRRA